MSSSRTDTSNGERSELKYRIDLGTYHRLRCALRAFTRYDRFCLNKRNHRYFVRSLYLDTWDYLAYEEKVTGIANRVKLRFRTYWPDPGETEFLRLELKTKRANRVHKFSERISVADYQRFLTDRSWPESCGDTAREFRRRVLLKDLRPKVLVDYDREALVPVDGSDVKITFDHDMRFAFASELFPRRPLFVAARPRSVVMEVKVRHSQPHWLHRIVRQFELPSVPNSKYATGIERTQHSLAFR